MSPEDVDAPGEEEQRSWRDRIAAVGDAGAALTRTRLAILREELAGKVALLLRGAVTLAIALGLAAGVLLLLAAFLAALLAHLFGNVVLGILGALVLYAAGAAAAGVAGAKALARLKPFDFPAAAQELKRDWIALRASWGAGGKPFEDADEEADAPPQPPPTGAWPGKREESRESLEERYRAGAE